MKTKISGFISAVRVPGLVIAGLGLILLSGFYVFQIIQITGESYFLLDSRERFQDLSQNNEQLKICFTENKSLETIDALAHELNYEKISELHYIQAMDNVVARAE